MVDAEDEPRRSGEFGHIPVMGARIVELLTPALDSDDPRVFLDATLGAGGHSQLVLESFPNVRVVGIDRDSSALEIARERAFENRLHARERRSFENGVVSGITMVALMPRRLAW